MTNKLIWPWAEKPRNKFFIMLILTACLILMAVKCFINGKELAGIATTLIVLFDGLITFAAYLKWKNKI